MATIEESNKRLRERYLAQTGKPAERIPARLRTAKGEWWKTDKGTIVHICDDLTEMDPVPHHEGRPYRDGLYCPGCNARLTREGYR